MTTKNNGKYIYRGKIYDILTCYTDDLTIPIICKYQMIKENGTIFKELHPFKAEKLLSENKIKPLN